MSFLSEQLELGDALHFEASADPAVYRRGENSASIMAIPGTKLFRVNNEFGVSTVVQSSDFIVRASDIGSFSRPKRGDKIIFNSSAYEVLEPGGEPCWEWSDAKQSLYRIHTKFTGAANVV